MDLIDNLSENFITDDMIYTDPRARQISNLGTGSNSFSIKVIN